MDRTTSIFLLTILAIFFLYASMEIKPMPEGISGRTSEVDINSVSTTGQPVILYFYMQRCSACKHFEPLFKEKEKQYKDKFEFRKVDVYTSRLAEKLKVRSLPAVYIIEPKTRTASKIKTECIFSPYCFDKTLKTYTPSES